MRDVEEWEADFMEMAMARRQATAKRYPQQLIDMITASSTVVEGGGEGGSKGGAGGGGEEEDGGSGGGGGGGGLASFYDRSAAAKSSTATESSGAMTAAPRESAADKIKDVRSLDRAYTHRLVMLLRNAATGGWELPGGEVLEGEKLRSAAERSLRGALSVEGELDVWFVGHAPIGHAHVVYDAATQAATGRYGARVFYYRAELLGGRPRLATPSHDDFAWLTRDETEGYLPRPAYKYLHQVFGSGPGEEVARREAWQTRIAAAGLTPAAATGRRHFRVRAARTAGTRLPAVVTAKEAASAAAKWGDAAKAGQLREHVHHRNVAAVEQRKAAAAARLALAIPPAAALAAAKRASSGRVAAAAAAAAAAATASA